MAKLTLEDLRRMRGEKQKEMEMRDASNKDVQVIWKCATRPTRTCR